MQNIILSPEGKATRVKGNPSDPWDALPPAEILRRAKEMERNADKLDAAAKKRGYGLGDGETIRRMRDVASMLRAKAAKRGKTAKSNPPRPDEESTPLDSGATFSARWIDEANDNFLEDDIFDAYEDKNGKVFGLSIRGEWVPVGKEGQSWEWANYGGLKRNPVDTPYAGSYADTMSRRASSRGIFDPRTMPATHQESQRLMNIQRRMAEGLDSAAATRAEDAEFPRQRAYVEKAVKANPRVRVTVDTPRRWYFVNHANGVTVGPMTRAAAVRLSDDANLNHGGDTVAVSEAVLLRDYNGGFYKAPVRDVIHPSKTNGARPPKDHYFVYTRDGSLVAGPISKTGAVTRTHHDGSLVYYVAQDAAQFKELERGVIPKGLYAASAKPNGFKHARPFGGSVGREQWHVHFEDAKGVIWYYAGNTDKGVKLEREYSKAMKFNASRAAQLAKRLDRLYKNVRHDGGHFYAESASDVKANGERGRYTTYAAWRAACRKIDRNFRVEGDKDIAQAFSSTGVWIGEWDGAVGVVRKSELTPMPHL